MTGQMTIFDFPKAPSDLDELPEESMVQQVIEATGIPFVFVDDFCGWQARIKGTTYSVHYSNYRLDDNKNRFISCSYDNNKGGARRPCDSIGEAVVFFERALERNANETSQQTAR